METTISIQAGRNENHEGGGGTRDIVYHITLIYVKRDSFCSKTSSFNSISNSSLLYSISGELRDGEFENDLMLQSSSEHSSELSKLVVLRKEFWDML